MARSTVVTLVLAFAALVGLSRQAPAEPWDALLDRMWNSGSEVTAFLHVNVIPMDSARVAPDQTVLVRDGKIDRIGASSDIVVPGGARRIEGRGKYLLPGLVDMHFHMPGAGADTADIDRYLALFVANGVTTVRCTVGAPQHPRIRDDVRAGRRFGPTLYVAARPISSSEVTSPEQARELVRRYRAERFDFIKLYGIADSTVYDAVVETALQEGLTCFGHISAELGIERALRSRQGLEHLDGYFTAERKARSDLPRLARETRDAGIWNCPTQFYCEYLYTRDVGGLEEREGVALVPDSVRLEWVERKRGDIVKYAKNREIDSLELLERRRVIRALDESGAGLLLGADTPGRFRIPGFAMMEEARAFRAAGLSTRAVLAAGTRNAAAALGKAGEFGIVAAGARADLVLLEGDPLRDIENLRRRAGVMLRGVWFPADELDAMAREAAQRLGP